MLPGVADVADVLLLALVEVPEHALQQHVAEADHGVQRRPQLVRHRGQELRLVPVAISSAREVITFWIAIAPWVANLTTRAIVRSSKGAIAARQSTMTPSTRSSASIGTPSIVWKPPSSSARAIVYRGSDLASSSWTVRRSGPDAVDHAAGPGGQRHADDVVAVGLRGAERGLAAVDVAVEDVDQPGVGAAQAHGLLEHGLEDRLELERRAPEHLEHAVGSGLALQRLREVCSSSATLVPRPATQFVTSTSFQSPPISRAVCEIDVFCAVRLRAPVDRRGVALDLDAVDLRAGGDLLQQLLLLRFLVDGLVDQVQQVGAFLRRIRDAQRLDVLAQLRRRLGGELLAGVVEVALNERLIVVVERLADLGLGILRGFGRGRGWLVLRAAGSARRRRLRTRRAIRRRAERRGSSSCRHWYPLLPREDDCQHRQREHGDQAGGLRDRVGGAETVQVQGVIDRVQQRRDRPRGGERDDQSRDGRSAAQANRIANAR